MALSLFGGFQDPFLQDFERTMRRMDPTAGMLSFPRVSGFPAMAQVSSFHPMDIVEHNDRYSIIADAPGMTPEDISVELTDNDTLVVTGEKSTLKDTTDEQAGARVHRSERTFNSFTRSFMLPQNAQRENITATVEHGVLTVTIPKKPEEQARSEAKRIKVTGSSGAGRLTAGAGAGTTVPSTTTPGGVESTEGMQGTTPETGAPTTA